MNSPHSSLPESVFASFQKLQAAAATLNAVSDELGKSITRIEDSLKKLNLGVSVWVPLWTWDDSHEGGTAYQTEDVGYSKIGGRWGIGLRKVSGDYQNPEGEQVEEWLFNDAPRMQRLQAIGKITELLESLSEAALKMTAQVEAKLATVQAVADAVSPKPLQRPLSVRPVTVRTPSEVK